MTPMINQPKIRNICGLFLSDRRIAENIKKNEPDKYHEAKGYCSQEDKRDKSSVDGPKDLYKPY